MKNSYKEKILKFVSLSTTPVDVEKIRKSCGIANWNTALKHCLELLIQDRIRGQKTSKSWVFWTHQETLGLRPWQEAVGTYKTLETNENEVTLTLQRTPTNMKLSFPKNSTEANTLTKTLQNTPKNTKINILLTDNPQKPLIIKTFNEPTATKNSSFPLLSFRKRASFVLRCVRFFEGGH